MIDNFDQLVARCNARRRRRMIRLSLLIVSSILLAIASFAGYDMWISQTQKTAVIQKTTEPLRLQKIKTETVQPVTETEPEKTVEKEPMPIVNPLPVPASQTPKTRLYSLQLTSSKSYDKTASALRKVPEKYRSGMAIYLINGYYALRYNEIFDSASLPNIIDDFKQSGFKAPIAYKYTPDRCPVTEEEIRRADAMNAETPAVTANPAVPAAASAAVTPANPIPAVSANKETASSPLFKVNNQKSVLSDPLKAYENDPKYETALTIAQNYYGKNEFAEAAKWAKKANQLNREAEEAWLLYAKSYYAQGRKNEAIGVLELYLNYKDSKAATELLRTWKRP